MIWRIQVEKKLNDANHKTGVKGRFIEGVRQEVGYRDASHRKNLILMDA